MDMCSSLTHKVFTFRSDSIVGLTGKNRLFFPFHSHKSISFNVSSSGSTALVTKCQLRGPHGDDDSEPSIVNSDWRAFRARLVTGEQATKSSAGASSQWPDLRPAEPSSVIKLGQMWAHPIHEPERGCLLVATQRLDGVHIFERTVILVLSMGAVGATGVILNRPSLMSIKETRSTDLDVNGVFSDRPLFFGGPLEEGLFLMSAQSEGLEREGGAIAFDEVMKGLYYGMKESAGCAAEMVRRKVVGLGDFRFFDGWCGWEREQLTEEIRAGYWKVVACSQGAIGLSRVGSVSLWSDILGLMGEKPWLDEYSMTSPLDRSIARRRRRRLGVSTKIYL